jgi:glutathione S-transferase
LVKGKILSLEVDGNNNKLESIQSINRHLATTLDKTLTGSNALELTEVDSWLDFAQALVNTTTEASFNELATILESSLNNKQYLVANRLTIADFAVLSSLKCTSLPF